MAVFYVFQLELGCASRPLHALEPTTDVGKRPVGARGASHGRVFPAASASLQKATPAKKAAATPKAKAAATPKAAETVTPKRGPGRPPKSASKTEPKEEPRARRSARTPAK